MSFSSALVTGASGFIGKALVEELRADGIQVSCLGRSRTRLPAGGHSIVVDTFSAADLSRALDGCVFDVIFHLAAYGVSADSRNAREMFDVNVVSTDLLVHWAAISGCRAFVYSGSCAEYRSPRHGVLIAEDHALSDGCTYGASKAAAGLWCSALAKSLDLPFMWTRLFGVYGPGEGPNRLLPYIAQCVSRGKSVDLSPGEQWRDVIYVDDAVRGLRAGAELAVKGITGPFNICTGEAVKVKTIARVAAAQLDASPDLLAFGARDYRPDETMWMVGDPAAFRAATGFRPSVSLEDGIERFVRSLPGHRLT